MELSPFPRKCDTRCKEAEAFPSALHAAVQEVAACIATSESHRSCSAFHVRLNHETLNIPYRVYYKSAMLRRELGNFHGVRRLILACLGTRHHDGYLRQECLAELLHSEEAWLSPYIVQLAGEYVVEITDDVAEAIVRRNATVLASFVQQNPDYVATLQRKVTSYWSCYHRAAYPDRNNYPGTKVMAFLKQVIQ